MAAGHRGQHDRRLDRWLLDGDAGYRERPLIEVLYPEPDKVLHRARFRPGETVRWKTPIPAWPR
jgi:hypothetical protein